MKGRLNRRCWLLIPTLFCGLEALGASGPLDQALLQAKRLQREAKYEEALQQYHRVLRQAEAAGSSPEQALIL
ncbi:MAG: hypothetical protein AB1898_32620, partial [Acidobacteriota bacterium]